MTDAPTSPATIADPAAHAEAVVRRSGTSFFWAMRRLPAVKRAAMYAIYAFCREVDDIADEVGAEAGKRRRLAEWRDEIGRLYDGAPESPTGRALVPAVDTFGLRRDDFEAVIAGMEMDAGDRLRIGDRAELTLYCDRVASAVGRLSTRVFGLDAETGERLADAQGQALQLTNILRDVDEDAGRDRLYLPADMLAAEGIADTMNLADVLAAPGLARVCEELAADAGGRFAAALDIIDACDRDAVRPARMMLEVYRRILDELTGAGWAAPRRRVGLSAAAKLWVLVRYGLL